MEFVEYEPEFIPEAVMNYYSYGVQVGRSTKNNKDLILKAKKHLAAIGWSFFYISKKPGRRELRYRSPLGKTYCSLRSACQELIRNQEHNLDDRGGIDLDGSSKITEIVNEKKTELEKNDEVSSNDIRPQKRVRIQDDDHDHDLDQLGGTSKTEIAMEKIKKLEENDEVSIDNGRPQKKTRVEPDDRDLEWSCSKIERETSQPQKKIRIQDDDDHDLESTTSMIERKTNRPQKEIRIQDDGDHDLESSSSKIESSTERKTSVRPQKKIRIQDVEASYFHQKREESCAENSNDNVGIEDENEGFRNPDRPGKRLKRLMKYSGKKRDDFTPKKRVRKASDSSTRRRCVLSILIERKIVTRGTKVSYRGRKDGRVMAEGRVFEEGIQCDCCGEFFLLSKFEAHAGSTYRRPAANIFLDDGRSLLDCQTRLTHENGPKSTKSGDGDPEQDEFCSFCNDGGELLLCDSCTSSFHASCIGLNGVPDSDYWFCPFCCCQICHQDQISSLFTCEYVHKIKCKQCEHHFHTNCLKEKGVFVSSDTVNWLCSGKCETIFNGLMAMVGKPIPATVDNLSWTLLKLENENDTNLRAEINAKLNVALDVMHECFEPMKHPRSDGDVVEDVVFGRRSKRSDFSGFFTAVLERDEEVVSVVTVRVHGCKAAEIPLVATRFRYRKMGMCRILMDEIEKVMEELGVERIVLPAVPEMVKTWTESFGFEVMDEIERLKVVECKFLDFPGTIKCQKILKKM